MFNFGDGVVALVKGLAVIACISVPLAAWKAIEIIVWLVSHVSVNWT